MHSNNFDNCNNTFNNNFQNPLLNGNRDDCYIGQPIHDNHHHNAMNQHNNHMNMHHNNMNMHNNNMYHNNQYMNQQYQQNPPVIFVDGQQNLMNVNYPNPEIVYCTATVRSNNRRYNNGIGENGIMNALRQVQGELNLNLQNIQIIGNCNMLSNNSVEQNMIEQIIQNNQHIPSERIRQGKVVYCCNALSRRIKKFGYILICLFLISLIFQGVGDSIVISNQIDFNGEMNQMAIPYILQIILWAFVFVMVLVSLLKCYPRLLSYISIIAGLNILVCFFIIVISNVVSFNEREFNNFGIVLAIQICMIFLSFIIMILMGILAVSMKRLCILLKQIDESEFLNGCCV